MVEIIFGFTLIYTQQSNLLIKYSKEIINIHLSKHITRIPQYVLIIKDVVTIKAFPV